MSFVSSLFAAPGESAARSQTSRDSQVGGEYQNLFNQAAPQYGQFLSSLASKNVGGAIDQGLNTLNQDPNQKIATFGAGAQERAAQNSAQYANYLKSQGYGDGSVNGAAQGQFQNAAAQTNQYAAQQYSPEQHLQNFMTLINAINGAQGTYGNMLNTTGSGVYGQPQVQVGQNPLASILGQAAGAYTSGHARTAGKKAGA